MPLSVRNSGSWRAVRRLHVRDGGSWKEVLRAWVRDSGVWKMFHAIGVINTSIPGPSASGIPATLNLQSGGTFTSTGNSSGEWADPTDSAPLWEVRATHVSGNSPTGTYNEWLAMTSNRVWSLNSTGFGTVTFEWRLAGTTEVLYTQSGMPFTRT